MMILHSSPASPFGRKVKLAAYHLDLADKIDIRTADLMDESDPVFAGNPLGKIPTLTLDDGSAVYDSRVILEYLDQLAGGGKILPTNLSDRMQALTLQASVDGLLDAAILQVYERRFRPEEKVHQSWLDKQAAKVSRTLTALEANTPAKGGPLNVGTITLACALAYLDFRFAGTWRNTHPNLVSWLADFEARVPAFDKTRPTD